MEKLKTGIYGGSFNPIHNGHIQLARQFLKGAGLDEVWLMVSPQNPWKQQEELLDDDKRFRLMQLALNGEKGLVAKDYEFYLPRPSYTWNTLQKLSHDFPDRSFTLLVGGDNWAYFHDWYHYKDILKNYPVCVYPREGITINEPSLPPHVSVLHAPLIHISSTDIRRRIQNHESIDDLVPKAVVEEMVKNGDYQDGV
ncbi:MAG: nicotinate-nucleotide adenylyltransferase [Prevotella sp.]|jgi:nicotinate-nucleotide adenylyltransferase|nr:nicotinate (nicotinamide) nucleotide adenylyltransferase [Prevotella sp.]MCH4181767.1 nicotinate-nucleotide adenylyltransferase [Prevotella sp.]MCH4211575.1 nicotinate-nucleotide adenylyltransferase [Prevotella sp.]MCH4240352.1 nicotinate-nucleotide adenylyltransferase [Prevotella sp.]MCI1741886.1 nicotinate-nucleotide adenylyltransferase [Prevotella sp.]